MWLMRDRGLAGPPGCVTADYAIRLRRPTPVDRPVRAARLARLDRMAAGSSSTPNWHPVASSPPHAAARSSPSVPTIRRTSAGRGASCSIVSSIRSRAPAATPAARRADRPTSLGDTATVRRIVAKLEAMPPEQARLIASAAYTLARAANADLDISDEETAAIERELQAARVDSTRRPRSS